MKIIGLGDIHMDLGGADTISGISDADLVIVTGDITNFGSSRDAQTVLNRLRQINPSLLAVAGNLDQPEVTDYLEELEISLHGRGIMLDNLGIIGLGGSNYTPFKTPFEFSEKKLASLLASGHEQVKDAENFILVSHTPPYRTTADRLTNGSHVGSTAVREFIEERQPLVCLSGHIHESAGEDRIGRTTILNPGMIKHGGYIEIFCDNNEIAAVLHS